VLACAANDKPVSHCALFSSSIQSWVDSTPRHGSEGV
jgi:hypothetical protein